MKRHIVFCAQAASEAGVNEHAQLVMRDLGVSWLMSTPQSIADQWWFWCCEGLPEPLPDYLRDLKIEPREAVGYGLTSADAERIEREAAK